MIGDIIGLLFTAGLFAALDSMITVNEVSREYWREQAAMYSQVEHNVLELLRQTPVQRK